MHKKPTQNEQNTKPHAFAPEAAMDYGDVPLAVIAAFREKMAANYGFGQGRMIAIDDPYQKD